MLHVGILLLWSLSAPDNLLSPGKSKLRVNTIVVSVLPARKSSVPSSAEGSGNPSEGVTGEAPSFSDGTEALGSSTLATRVLHWPGSWTPIYPDVLVPKDVTPTVVASLLRTRNGSGRTTWRIELDAPPSLPVDFLSVVSDALADPASWVQLFPEDDRANVHCLRFLFQQHGSEPVLVERFKAAKEGEVRRCSPSRP